LLIILFACVCLFSIFAPIIGNSLGCNGSAGQRLRAALIKKMERVTHKGILVDYDKLSKLLDEIPYNSDETYFISSVQNVIPFKENAMVIVQIYGSYPYMENKWDEYKSTKEIKPI